LCLRKVGTLAQALTLALTLAQALTLALTLPPMRCGVVAEIESW